MPVARIDVKRIDVARDNGQRLHVGPGKPMRYRDRGADLDLVERPVGVGIHCRRRCLVLRMLRCNILRRSQGIISVLPPPCATSNGGLPGGTVAPAETTQVAILPDGRKETTALRAAAGPGALRRQAARAGARSRRGRGPRERRRGVRGPPREPAARPRCAERHRRPGDCSWKIPAVRWSRCSRAIELNPREPAYRCHLAIAYRSLAKPDLAAAATRGRARARSHAGGSAFESRQPAARAGRPGRRRRPSSSARSRFGATIPSRCTGWAKRDSRWGALPKRARTSSRRSALDPALPRRPVYDLSRARSAMVAELERAADGSIDAPSVVANADRRWRASWPRLQLSRDNPAYSTQSQHRVRNFDLRHPVDPRSPRSAVSCARPRGGRPGAPGASDSEPSSPPVPTPSNGTVAYRRLRARSELAWAATEASRPAVLGDDAAAPTARGRR